MLIAPGTVRPVLNNLCRMEVKKKNELQAAMRDLEQNINLIEAPTTLRQKGPVQIKLTEGPQKSTSKSKSKAKPAAGDNDDMQL